MHLLLNRKKNIGPYINSSTKQHLLKISKILHRDTSPSIKLTKKCNTSEGGNQYSEGVGRVAIEKYLPSIRNRSEIPIRKLQPKSSKDYLMESIKMGRMDTLLCAYAKAYENNPPKYKVPSKLGMPDNLPKPNVPLMNVPTPKLVKASHEPKTHPMILRKNNRSTIHKNDTPYENLTAQHLYDQNYETMNHIYDASGNKMSVDSLLKSSPEIW